MVRHVLDQPIDRVVRVRGFVDLIAGLVGNVRPHIFVDAFAHVTAAHVLINKDVAFAREQLARPQRRTEFLRAVRRDAVRRAIEHDRILFAFVLRFVDRREQPHSVAHGDVDLALGVMVFDVVGEFALFFRQFCLRQCTNSGPENQQDCGRQPGRTFQHHHPSDLLEFRKANCNQSDGRRPNAVIIHISRTRGGQR